MGKCLSRGQEEFVDASDVPATGSLGEVDVVMATRTPSKGLARPVPPEATLTDTEARVLAKLVDHFKGTSASEYMCLQVMRSSDVARGDSEEEWVQGAIKVIEPIVAWRTEHKIDGITDEHLDGAERFRVMWPDIVLGEDSYGRPVHWQLVARIPADQLMREYSQEQVVRLHAQATEQCRNKCLERCARDKLPFVGQIEVLDLTGFGMQHLSPKFFRLIRTVMEVDLTKYDGMMQGMIVINVPWLFARMWSLLSPLLEESTKSKIFLCDERASASKLREFGIDVFAVPEGVTIRDGPHEAGKTRTHSLKL